MKAIIVCKMFSGLLIFDEDIYCSYFHRKTNTGTNKTRLLDLEIFKNFPFILYTVANIPTVMGVYSLYSYLPAVSNINIDTEYYNKYCLIISSSWVETQDSPVRRPHS